MSADAIAVTRGWRVRIAVLWTAVVVMVAIGVGLLAEYGRRFVLINEAYLDESLDPADYDALNEQWLAVELLQQTAAPLIGGAFVLAVLIIAVQARGWDLRRELARSRRLDRPEQ